MGNTKEYPRQYHQLSPLEGIVDAALQTTLDPQLSLLSYESQAAVIDNQAASVNEWIMSCTPSNILERPNSFPIERSSRKLLHRLSALDSNATLVMWHQAGQMTHLRRNTLFVEKEPPFDTQVCKLAEQAMNSGIDLLQDVNIPAETGVFDVIFSRWKQAFEQQTKPESQARMLSLLYEIENPFRNPPDMLYSLVDQLHAELYDDAHRATEDLEDGLRHTLAHSLAEMMLAAQSIKSAWAYVGTRLPNEFIHYLFDTDNRVNALRLFADLIVMAKNNVFIYPPQLYYLFRIELPKHVDSHGAKFSFRQTMDELYSQGMTLTDLISTLNFTVTGRNRGSEYFPDDVYLFDEHFPPGDFVSFFSGPPLTALEMNRYQRELGDTFTVDIQSIPALIDRALALPDELAPDCPPYAREHLTNLVLDLSGPHYPVTNDSYPHHIVAQLPDSTVAARFKQREVTCIADQRGVLLYLPPHERLEQLEVEAAMLSGMPRSLWFLTRGVASKFMVDTVMRRSRNNTLELILWDRSDSRYLQSDSLPHYLKGGFEQGKARYMYDHPIQPAAGRVSKDELTKILGLRLNTESVSLWLSRHISPHLYGSSLQERMEILNITQHDQLAFNNKELILLAEVMIALETGYPPKSARSWSHYTDWSKPEDEEYWRSRLGDHSLLMRMARINPGILVTIGGMLLKALPDLRGNVRSLQGLNYHWEVCALAYYDLILTYLSARAGKRYYGAT